MIASTLGLIFAVLALVFCLLGGRYTGKRQMYRKFSIATQICMLITALSSYPEISLFRWLLVGTVIVSLVVHIQGYLRDRGAENDV